MQFIANEKICPFCSIVKKSYSSTFRKIFSVSEVKNEIIFESLNFIFCLDIGPIVNGYSLIISKKHIPSFAYLSIEEIHELIQLKHIIHKILTKLFGKPIFFEHGAASLYENAGCCIEHAHLHAIPTYKDLSYIFFADYDFELLKSYEKLVDYRTKGYLFYENHIGTKYCYQASNIPSQYVRKIISLEISKRPWNWCDYVNFPSRYNTKKIIYESLNIITKLIKNSNELFQEYTVEIKIH